MNQLHVLLVTEDPALARGISDALSDQQELTEVQVAPPSRTNPATERAPDLIILDAKTAAPVPAAECFPEAMVLRLWHEGDATLDRDVEGHFDAREHGFIRREDLGQVGPVLVALASLGVAARRR